MNTIKINGSALAGIYVDASQSFEKPRKRLETFSVPGRNGDFIIDEGTFDNVVVTFPVFERETFPAEFNTITNGLAALKGYQKLECSNDASHYRMARFVVPESPTAKSLNRDGYYDLTFECKPQRYLNTGDAVQTYSSSGTITNPTEWPSLPNIRIYGVGKVTVGAVEITVSTNSTYTDVDCEMQDCHKDSTNLNANVSFSGNDFPTIPPGSSTVTLGTGITKVEITPRWWEL